jgi:hypothetical protein
MGDPIWDWFGYSVEVHNNFAAVGGPIDNPEPSGLGGIGACCCCEPDNEGCLDNLDEEYCLGFGGQYAGEGIFCDEVSCPVSVPVVYGPGAVTSLWCTREGPGMPVPQQLPNTYTNVKLPGGECIWMECVYPNCPYPNCKK